MANKEKNKFERIALVLQGGGARGAYHLGAYKALEEAGYIPDIFCGISIGALSACVLAGNSPGERIKKLEQFWEEITWPELPGLENILVTDEMKKQYHKIAAMQAVMFGQPNFFTPWFPTPQLQPKGTPMATSYYDTSKMKDTLQRLSNFDYFNKEHKTRLITGATKIKTGELTFFDSGEMALTPDHVLASGSLPPGFPGARIDGDLYWDGGALSNSPIEGIFRIKPPKNTLVFMIDLFDGASPDPQTLDEVDWTSSGLLFASRTSHNIKQESTKHNLRKALNHLLGKMPGNLKNDPVIDEIKDFASDVNYHFVHIIYNAPAYDTNASGHEFSRFSVKERASHGYEDMQKALETADWLHPHAEHIGSKVHTYRNPNR
jgi:NTE family protein